VDPPSQTRAGETTAANPNPQSPIPVRPTLTGWINYYRLGRNYAEVKELDRWVRRRVRQCYWKQWKRPRCRRRNLLRLGADPEQVHLCSRSRKGCWRMATNSIVQAALTNEWLEKQGVVSLQQAWIAYHYPGGAPRVVE